MVRLALRPQMDLDPLDINLFSDSDPFSKWAQLSDADPVDLFAVLVSTLFFMDVILVQVVAIAAIVTETDTKSWIKTRMCG